MTKIQLGSGASSSTTHRITQSSQTIDRRNVIRPSNLAIEEAARSSQNRTIVEPSSARPSRLVNLRVHAADLIQAQEEPIVEPIVEETPVQQSAIVPNVIELGAIDRSQPADLPPIDLSKMVPEEAPVEDINTFTQTVASQSSLPVTTDEIAVMSTTMSVETTPMAPMTSTPTSMPEMNSQDLAMSIAADYATASLGAAEAADNSIDTIARATSEAIAAIRSATDPEEIAEQVASLKSFADNLKASSAAPEMLELSNTIDKFIGVAMKSTKIQEEVQKKVETKTATKSSATAKSPVATKSTSATPKTIKKVSAKTVPKATTTRAVARPAAKPVARRTTRATARNTSKLVTDEDQALRNALRNVAAMDGEPETQPLKRPVVKKRGAGKRLVLAFFCAVACVAAVVYFVGSNIPDISVKVAAIQTGIEASYPSYIPRDYSLSDINSENGKITMAFKGPEKSTFTLTEEKSSWDSTALLRNYVEPTWQTNYVTTHEQGITIYISGANAAWVNGGVLYKINDPSNTLTKKQLRNIVTSM